MEIDFGGLGKEYAVDKSAELLRQASAISVLINFGGDIGVTQPRIDGQPWMVGIENVEQEGQAVKLLQLKEGAIATSGDSKRFVWVDGKRRGHILDPRTGWPVEGAPRSVTVAARTCTEAGFLSTWAMLNGKDAEQFLKTPGIQSWCLR
jgi:thiamine biosynthesis lipoprotein